MMCDCHGFHFFDRAHLDLVREAFGVSEWSKDMITVTYLTSGFVLTPTWWWREPSGLDSSGNFNVVVHKAMIK